MQIDSICLLGLGEVGFVLAEDLLVNTRVVLRVWDKQLDKEDSVVSRRWQTLSDNCRVQAAKSAATAVENCQLVLSAVTADEALIAARSVIPGLSTRTWFVDLNSVSPETKHDLSLLVEQAGGRFVEAAIMSPIKPARSASSILLSGIEANTFELIGKAIGFSGMRAVSKSLGTASATKMCRSVIIKGMEALVTESLLTANHYGVESAVLESLGNLFPRTDWPEHARYLISRSIQHGTRRAAEMREAAKTVAEAGIDPWMSEACARRQDWAAQYESELKEATLEGLLGSIQSSLDQSEYSLKMNKSNKL